jgi:sugar phosphate isomerase/epimerase
MNRRTFLGQGASLGIGLHVASTATAQTPIKRAGKPRFKTSLNAYSFNKALTSKEMTLLNLLDYCAEQNFDALDPTGYYFPGYPKPPVDSLVNEFKRRAHELGLDISGTGVRTEIAAVDAEKRAADVRHAKEWIEVAARLGAPVLRVFAGKGSEDQTLDAVAGRVPDCLREVAEHGQKFGVIVGFQNHWDAVKTAEEVLAILKRVDSPWVGMVADTGSFHTPDPYRDIAAIAPFAVNWQVKENLGGGKQDVVKTDLVKVVRIAKEAGYRGYLPIEALPNPGEEYNPHVQVPRLLKELREAITTVG